MASEYHTVRSRILSVNSLQRRTSFPPIQPLTPIHPPSDNHDQASPAPSTPDLTGFPSSDYESSTSIPKSLMGPLAGPVYPPCPKTPPPSFLTQLATHLKSLSEGRLSRGFLHLTPSLIHSNAFLENPVQRYQHLTDLFRRIDINFYNISTSKLECWISNILIRLVYASNYLSHNGTDFATTSRIASAIFNGSGITELNLPNTPGYRSEISALQDQGRPEEFATVLKGREQVVQFTKALMHFLQKFVIEDGGMTQELIRKTHRILVKDHELVDGKSWEKFGGWYRDYRVLDSTDYETNILMGTISKEIIFECPSEEEAEDEVEEEEEEEDRTSESGSTIKAVSTPRRISIDPRAVSVYMSKLVNLYHAKISRETEPDGTLSDPFALSAWFYTEFLHVHPFITMNGTVARIILTGLLFKELGVVAMIGEEREQARREYIGVLERWKERYKDESAGGVETLEESYAEFAALVVRKGAECVEELAMLVGSS